jgi:hypothetical protein
MMVVTGMMMVPRGGKGRAGKHQQKQDSYKNLFHETNVARELRRW